MLDLLCLIFSIKLEDVPSFASPEALASSCHVDLDLVRRIEDIGLLRSEPSRPGRLYDADDARVTAVIAELMDLGATAEDIDAFGRHLLQRCGKCGPEPCPTRCDAIEVLRTLLRRIAEKHGDRAGRRQLSIRIERAITSIDALADLI
jgi:DNA-binding transcriptional MerR regulator